MLSNLWSMIMNNDIFSKMILACIVMLSAYCWAIMYKKWRRFSTLRHQSEKILTYAKGKSAIQVLKVQIKATDHPLARILTIIKESILSAEGHTVEPMILQEEINGAISEIMEYEERHIDMLATISTITPFMGLLGTVWGITDSFWQIGKQASANIAVVAPGLSAALITTLFGLVAAIPACLGYNDFSGELRHLEGELEGFAKTTMARALRESKSS